MSSILVLHPESVLPMQSEKSFSGWRIRRERGEVAVGITVRRLLRIPAFRRRGLEH